jgi:signal transduction histidine kinase
MAYRQHICSAAGIVFCLLCCSARQPALAIEPKRVLLIYNSVGYQELVARNIRTELQHRSPELLEIYSAPFAAASVVDEGVTTRYADYLGALFRDQRLDVAVTVGSPATSFFRQYGRQLFPSAPMLAVLEESRVPSHLGRNETVVTSSLDLVGAIENILQVLPETTNVSVVIGNSPLEQYWLARQRVAFQPFASRVSFSWLNDLSFEDILKHAATLSSGSALLFNSLFNDAVGAAYEDHEVVSRLHGVAKAPIFTFDDSDFGQGIVGGPGPSTPDVSRDYASVALRILRGEVLGGVVIRGISAGQPKFDWREMQRWGIDESRLAPGSTIYYRDPTAWQRYRWQIMTIAGALLVQTLLILGLFYERHRRRIAEATSRQRMSELAHMNRRATVGEMTSSMAHELNQPLGAILSNAETAEIMLSSRSPNLDEIKEILADIRRDDHRASEIIRRLRSLLKKTAFEPQEIDLNETVREVFDFIAVLASARNVAVNCVADSRALRVTGDPTQLQQVLVNLIVNGMDAMVGVPNLQRKITGRTVRLDEASAEVAIADFGPGIPLDKLTRVFEPFYTTKEHGMGMGLSIARTIVEAHGGRIWAENQAGGGAVFRLSLPLAKTG